MAQVVMTLPEAWTRLPDRLCSADRQRNFQAVLHSRTGALSTDPLISHRFPIDRPPLPTTFSPVQSLPRILQYPGSADPQRRTIVLPTDFSAVDAHASRSGDPILG